LQFVKQKGFVRLPGNEAIKLYRDILRAVKNFDFPDEKGRPWKELIQESARREFEQSRYETNPEIIARMLITGRDCLDKVKEKMIQKANELSKNPSSRKG